MEAEATAPLQPVRDREHGARFSSSRILAGRLDVEDTQQALPPSNERDADLAADAGVAHDVIRVGRDVGDELGRALANDPADDAA